VTCSAAAATVSWAPAVFADGELPASDEYAAHQLIVDYRPATPEAGSDEAAAADVAAKSVARAAPQQMRRRLATGGVVVDLGRTLRGADLDAAIQRFRADADVASVEIDLLLRPMADVNDPEYAQQWDLFEAKAGMNVPSAWPRSTGKDVTVAVIDTGYVEHSDLDANIVAGYDFISQASVARDGDGRDDDPTDQGDWYDAGECRQKKAADSSWHGTHVAGTIAASANNGKGVAGIAYDAKISPIRVLGKCGGQTSDIADAIIWASGGEVRDVPTNANPAQVVNLSLGGEGRCSPTSQKAIDTATRNGTTVVVAAGNSNQDVANFTPAGCDNVIAVAASDRVGDRAFYSNFGNLIDIAAPGGEVRRESDPPGSRTTPEDGVLSTLNAGKQEADVEIYKSYMGTSMAAPHIAGLAALIISQNRSLTPAQVEERIKSTARPLPGTCAGGCGSGLADATKAVD
jgi:serine protease